MYYIKEYYNALPYEKVVQTKLKGTDVYKRYVDITDNKNIDYSDIFENLESIKAIRKRIARWLYHLILKNSQYLTRLVIC